MARTLLVFSLALLALALPAASTGKPPKLGEPPAETDCLGFTEPRGCFYPVRETEFDLNRHILRKGDVVTGVGRTIWKESSMKTDGEGLKPLGCEGKPYKGPVKCKWKAVGYTNAWTTGAGKSPNGIGIVVTTGGYYIDGTFYAIVGNDPAIEGFVTDGEGNGVEGAKVVMKGKGPDETAKTDDKGYYYEFVPKGEYKVSVANVSGAKPRSRTVQAQQDETAVADFTVCPDPETQKGPVKGCPRRIITATIDEDPHAEDADVGRKIYYEGSEWDPEGGPIKVTHDDKVVRKISARAAFSGKFEIPPYPTDRCKDTLRFEQDDLGRVVRYSTGHSQAIAFSDGRVTANGKRRLRHNDGVCGGETVKAGPDGTFAAIALNPRPEDDDARYLGVHVVSEPHDLDVHGLIAERVVLGFLSNAPSLKLPPSVYTTEKHCNVTDKPGVVSMPNERVEEHVDFHGYYYRDGSLKLLKGATFRNSVVTVTGDMSLHGSFDGAGLACALGDMTIRSAGRWPRGERGRVAVIVDGKIVIRG